MSQNILKASEVSVDSLKFSEPKKSGIGNKVYVNNGFGSLYVQSPKANVLWDAIYYSNNDPKKPNSGNYNVQFSLSDMENNTFMKDFHDLGLDI